MNEQDESYRWVILVLAWVVGLVLAMPFFAYPPLLPEITLDLKMSTTETALLMSLTTLAFTSFHLVGGISADRFGTKKTMSLGLTILSASTLLSATANTSILELTTRLMTGVGIGLTGVCIIKVLSNWFPKKELPLAVGLQATGWAAGNATGLFFPVILEKPLGMGWRGPIYVFGLFGCVATIVFIILAKDRAPSSSQSSIGKTLPTILRLREFWFLTVAQLGFVASNTAIITWLPTALIDSGWTTEVAALATAVIALIGIPANLMGGVVSNRMGRRKPVLLLSGLALCLSTALLGFVLSGPLLWPVVCILGWFTFFFTGPFFATPSALPEVGVEKVGTFVGLMMIFSSVGGFISPIMVGLLRDSTGSYLFGFLMSAGFAAPLALPGLLGRETGIKT